MRWPLILLLPCVLAAADVSPTGTRITQPTLREVTPLGIPRGGVVEVSIVGYNLAKASAIYFSDPGIKANITRIKELSDQDDVRLGGNGTPLSIDLGPLPVRNEVTAELDIPLGTPVGTVNFRVLTPLGLTPQGTFAVEPYFGETPDREPNDTFEDAVEVVLPSILVGTISKPGDVDTYKIEVKAGERLVFDDAARALGSALQPVLDVFDANGGSVGTVGEDFAWTFGKAGTYYLRVGDALESGSGKHFYRIKVGNFPLLLTVFPLGLEKGKTKELQVTGQNLPTPKLAVAGEPSDGLTDTRMLRPEGSFTRRAVAVGNAPEVMAGDGATRVTVPVTVNGKMLAAHHDVHFHARKGQSFVLEVNAARLGSKLDSYLEVLDAKGQPVERATVRALLQTSLALRDHDSTSRNMRLESPSGLQVGDYLMTGGEIVRIDAMPKGPDDDAIFASFNGVRTGFLDTTPEAHAVDAPVYKVELHPAGMQFARNGLPLVHLMYANDDGGAGYGKDSLLHFVAPAEGEYIARLRDVRGLTGEEYAYRLTIREPQPDYRLSVTPRSINVPAGGRVPLTVTALRIDGHDAPIEVKLVGLPEGLHASSGVIAQGQTSTVLEVNADENAKLSDAAPLHVVDVQGREANADDRLKFIAVMPRADIEVAAAVKEVTIEAGGKTTIEVAVSRNNGFGGRVPLEVRNLPPDVRVIDIGLNGVLVNETETRRSFTLEALPGAQPIDQVIYVSGNVETRAASQNSYLSQPIHLHVKRSEQAAVKY